MPVEEVRTLRNWRIQIGVTVIAIVVTVMRKECVDERMVFVGLACS